MFKALGAGTKGGLSKHRKTLQRSGRSGFVNRFRPLCRNFATHCRSVHSCLKTKINQWFYQGDPMSRKFFAPLAVLLTLTLAACGGNPPEDAAAPPADTAPVEPAPTTPTP